MEITQVMLSMATGGRRVRDPGSKLQQESQASRQLVSL